MSAPLDTLRPLASFIGCTIFVIAACVISQAKPADAIATATTAGTIRIWKIGSPHTGDTPHTTVPLSLKQELSRRGVQITVEGFPARDFARTFFDAASRGDAPDVLVIDNMGVMKGITTKLGRFEGIATDPAFQDHFIHVTGAFDALLGPQRGWTYLFALSANHTVARTLAMRAPECASDAWGPSRLEELVEIIPTLATAYLKGDAGGLQAFVDPDRLPTGELNRNPARSVAAVRSCGIWANDKLAFASVNLTYETEGALGQTSVLLVLRKPFSRWLLLAAARDPISNGAFVKDVASIAASLSTGGAMGAIPAPATRLSPGTGVYPQPARGERFGTFTWRSSASDDVVVEIAEFAYGDDARLFVVRPARPASRRQIQRVSYGAPTPCGPGGSGRSRDRATSRSRKPGCSRTEQHAAQHVVTPNEIERPRHRPPFLRPMSSDSPRTSPSSRSFPTTCGSVRLELLRSRWPASSSASFSPFVRALTRADAERFWSALRPGGLVVYENAAGHDNQVLEAFSTYRVLRWEDVVDAPDWGTGEKMRIQRLVAQKPGR